MSMEKVHECIESTREEDIKILEMLVRQPSISAQNIGIRECGELVKKVMEDFGFENTALYETSGHPMVYGEMKSPVPNAKTILFYGHYDVQPPEPLEEWVTPPFEPDIRDGRMYGRGTADNKGQFLAHLLAIKAFKDAGEPLPVNVKFVVEGEEESGSPYMEEFVRAHMDILHADLVYGSDGGMHDSGAPYMYFGVRGMLQTELYIETATVDNHSGNKGGVIKNAAWEMVKLLGTMIDKDNKVLIEGFYDDVLPASEFDLNLIDKVPYNPEALTKIFGVNEPILYSKRDFYTTLMFKPTLTIDGIFSGYIGKGPKTCVPGNATAKLDMRLVHSQDPHDIFDKLQAHVNKHYPKAKLKYVSGIFPSKTATDLPISIAVTDVIRKTYGKEPIVLPTLSATNPDFVWTKLMGMPSITVPYGNADETNHAPNENMLLECMFLGSHATAEVMKALADLK